MKNEQWQIQRERTAGHTNLVEKVGMKAKRKEADCWGQAEMEGRCTAEMKSSYVRFIELAAPRLQMFTMCSVGL